MARLSDMRARKIERGSRPIAHGGIAGLRLEPGQAKGQGKWTLRFVSPKTAKRRDMGLGRYPEVGIAEAESRAFEARKQIADGIDPIEARVALRSELQASQTLPSFEVAARTLYGELKDSWRNEKHRDQWINTLGAYAFPIIGAKRVDELSASDFASVLRPIWLAKPETASRVKQRCHAVMKWCWAKGHCQANLLDVVDYLLPRQPSKRERVKHQPAMPWQDIPAFVSDNLDFRNGGTLSAAKALLLFVIMTAARSGEARTAKWEEIDLEAGVWVVPATRMKSRVEHRVPLSSPVQQLLILMSGRKRGLLFSSRSGGELGVNAMAKFLRDKNAPSDTVGRHATAHGFRSSFRDWASEHGFARDLAERALAHTIPNQTEAAYHRTDLLEQRRSMMEAWAAHVMRENTNNNVVELYGARK